MKKRLLSALAALPLLAPLVPAHAQDTIKIGMFGPLTGAAATGGISFRKGWEYGLKQINDAGGLVVDGKKKPIELIVEDSQSRAEVGLTAAQKLLTRDNVDILIGDMVGSDVTLATMQLAPAFPTKLFYTGEAISLDIAKKIAADPKSFAHVWKHNFSSDSYASTVNDTLMQLVGDGQLQPKNKSVAIFSEDTSSAKPIWEALEPLLAKNGWKVAMLETVPIGQSDFYPQISKLRQLQPDFIVSFFTAMNSGTGLVKQLREQGVKTPHFGINFPTLNNFIAAAGPAAEGLLYAPMLFDPVNNPRHREFGEKMKGFLGAIPDNNNVDAYCNAMLMADVITRAGSLQVAKLDAAMAATDHQCLTSRRVFNPGTHAPRTDAGYFQVPSGQIQNGQLYAVWPKSVATATYRAP